MWVEGLGFLKSSIVSANFLGIDRCNYLINWYDIKLIHCNEFNKVEGRINGDKLTVSKGMDGDSEGEWPTLTFI